MKQVIGKPRKRARQTVKNSHTSPKAIALAQRRGACLDWRSQGQAYHVIGKHLGISPSTVLRHVIAAIEGLLPDEKRQQVLELEMYRLDALQAAFFRNAVDGDVAAADMVLKIMNRRALYLGLNAETNKGGGVHVNIGNNSIEPGAEQLGIQVTFVEHHAPDVLEAVNGKLLGPKVVDHSEFK